MADHLRAPLPADTARGGGLRGGPGTLIEHPQLTQLSALLKAIDAGDRIIKGKLELFSCSKRSLTSRAQQDLVRRAPETITDSPLGPLSTDAAQNLLANLRSLLALLFVDYDCSAITPNDFERCPDKHTVVSTINQSLAVVVDRVHSGFLAEFWQTVQEVIDVVSCDIYAFRPVSGSVDLAENSLTAVHYFLIDPLRGRILFIGCVTRTRAAVRGGGGDSDSDVVLSQSDPSVSSLQQRGSGSEIGSGSLQEGEFAFSDHSSHDDMMD